MTEPLWVFDKVPRKPEQASFWVQAAFQWLPLVFIFLLFFFFMRQLQSGGGKAMSFGKSRAKLLTERTGRVTFDDVAGIEEAKSELEEIDTEAGAFDDVDESMDGDHGSALASAGWGTDEDYEHNDIDYPEEY